MQTGARRSSLVMPLRFRVRPAARYQGVSELRRRCSHLNGMSTEHGAGSTMSGYGCIQPNSAARHALHCHGTVSHCSLADSRRPGARDDHLSIRRYPLGATRDASKQASNRTSTGPRGALRRPSLWGRGCVSIITIIRRMNPHRHLLTPTSSCSVKRLHAAVTHCIVSRIATRVYRRFLAAGGLSFTLSEGIETVRITCEQA